MKKVTSKLTDCVHDESSDLPGREGLVRPIYPSTAFDYENVAETRYPRYFNTPNQVWVVKKICALEHAEDGLVFSSGMAAIFTTLLAQLKSGDHAVFQRELYGGTFHAVVKEFPRFGINFTFVDASDLGEVEKAIRPETKVLYIESPSNPMLKIVSLKGISEIAKRHGLISVIDNTFATPINQNPVDWGFDVVVHSGTKYIGGHSDICCGFMVSSAAIREQVFESALHFGGSVNAQTCHLLERSIKTLALRVHQQNKSAIELARFLVGHGGIVKVYYPGLEDHPGYNYAREQMTGFGGMLSFSLGNDAPGFIGRLKTIKRAVSLGGVESTICIPAKTSHSKMSSEERASLGIDEHLVRLSVGIEDTGDLIGDCRQALDSGMLDK